jgi:response regulator RpfG family c-di-GMP phosphodiesterase
MSMQQQLKILCVDDEPNILESFRRQLRGKFDLEVATSAAQALDLFKSGQRFSVVVSDMRMPVMDGVEFLKNVQKFSPLTVRVMLTGNADQETAARAVNDGQIFRFMNKPCSPETLEKVLEAATQQHKLLTAEKELLQNTLSGSIKVLSEILALSDPFAYGSVAAIRETTKIIARTLNIENSWELELAVMLHPIGWVTVPEAIKAKFRTGQTLTSEERQMIERVPELGNQFIKAIPRLEGVARIVLYCEKNFDGSGFPKDSIKGTHIPECARIIRIALALAKLESAGLSHEAALDALKLRAAEFDQEIVSKVCASKDKDSVNSSGVSSFEIQPNQLCPGQRLTENLHCNDGRLLLGA